MNNSSNSRKRKREIALPDIQGMEDMLPICIDYLKSDAVVRLCRTGRFAVRTVKKQFPSSDFIHYRHVEVKRLSAIVIVRLVCIAQQLVSLTLTNILKWQFMDSLSLGLGFACKNLKFVTILASVVTDRFLSHIAPISTLQEVCLGSYNCPIFLEHWYFENLPEKYLSDYDDFDLNFLLDLPISEFHVSSYEVGKFYYMSFPSLFYPFMEYSLNHKGLKILNIEIDDIDDDQILHCDDIIKCKNLEKIDILFTIEFAGDYEDAADEFIRLRSAFPQMTFYIDHNKTVNKPYHFQIKAQYFKQTDNNSLVSMYSSDSNNILNLSPIHIAIHILNVEFPNLYCTAGDFMSEVWSKRSSRRAWLKIVSNVLPYIKFDEGRMLNPKMLIEMQKLEL